MATYQLTLTLQPVQPGDVATLQWAVAGSQQLSLNGVAVPPTGSQSVVPNTTTNYALKIVMPDGTTRAPAVSFAVEEAVTPDPVTKRAPTVVLTPENIARLQRYPRPPQDNGRGLHFHLDLRDGSIDWTVQRLQEIHATWTLVYAQDELQAQRAAKACWAAGIMPVVRIGKKVDEFVDAEQYVRALQAINVPPYVQIYNEPGDGREWEKERPGNYIQIFGERWARHAAKTVDAGGYPGLQVMGKEELFAAIDAVAAIDRKDIWERAFFVIHNYGVNHPPAYPYDELTQQTAPGCTILEDSTSILSFLAFAHWMQERIGFVLPIIGGEGGWQFGVNDDRRYPEVIQPYHASYHRETFEWFRNGLLSNNEPLPDYLFSVTPWLVGGWNTAEDWWGGPLGDKRETIEAVASIPAFTRKFSWSSDAGDGDSGGGDSGGGDNGGEPGDDDTGDTTDQSLHWDERLTALGVRLTRATAPNAWRLVSAIYRDVNESDNKHHIYIKAIDADNRPLPAARFLVDWIGRHQNETPGLLTTDEAGMANYAMFINMHPEERDGILFATSQGQPGDRVDGMGLPNNRHVCFELIFQSL